MTIENKSPGNVGAVEVRAYLCELSELLLSWSWEGVVGYEAMVTQAAKAFGHDDVTVVFSAETATIQLDGQVSIVKTAMPGFPALAATQDLKNHLADVFDGKLTVPEARDALESVRHREPPYATFAVWLGVIIVSAGFAVDIVGTWEGVLYACVTAMATGVVFIAADRIPGFGKVAPLVAAFASGIIAMLGWHFGIASNAPGLLLVASTFVFIPGDSISMQAYELAEGRWSAAVDRFFYSVFMLILLATGAFLASIVTVTPLAELMPGKSAGDTFPWWAVYPGHLLFLIGIMLAFQMDKAHFGKALIVLLLSTAVAQGVSALWNELFGTLVATTICMMVSLWLARRPRSIPSFVLMIPVVFALSPGSHGLRAFESWLSQDKIAGVTDLWSLLANLLAIGIGLMLGRMIWRRHWLDSWASRG